MSSEKTGPFGDFCTIHQKVEPGDGYFSCLECGHLYLTEEELMSAFREAFKEFPEVQKIIDPGKVLACPLCGTDF